VVHGVRAVGVGAGSEQSGVGTWENRRISEGRCVKGDNPRFSLAMLISHLFRIRYPTFSALPKSDFTPASVTCSIYPDNQEFLISTRTIRAFGIRLYAYEPRLYATPV